MMRRPSFCQFLRHLLRGFQLRALPFRAGIGLLMVALNVPIGWGGAALCSWLGVLWHSPFWGIAAAGIYALSWIMLGLGIILAGKPAVQNLRRRASSAWRAWRRASRHQPFR